jgi:hypothetical protein
MSFDPFDMEQFLREVSGAPQIVTAPAVPPPPIEPTLLELQHSLWRELHTYPIATQHLWSVADAETWFAAWKQRVPHAGCDCGRHWAELIAVLPPRFESAYDFFIWSWEAHNAVNDKLRDSQGGHANFSLAEAIALYAAPPSWLRRYRRISSVGEKD